MPSIVVADPAAPTVGAVSLAGVGWMTDYTLPFVGVPVTVVTMAAAGALLSFAYGKPEESRKKLIGLAIANTFIGTASVTVIPAAFEITWISPLILPPLAFLSALFCRWIVPLFVDILPNLVRKFFNVEKGGKDA